jgi:hypothetical protein
MQTFLIVTNVTVMCLIMHGENRQVQQTPVLIISLVKNPAKDKT